MRIENSVQIHVKIYRAFLTRLRTPFFIIKSSNPGFLPMPGDVQLPGMGHKGVRRAGHVPWKNGPMELAG